MLGSHARSACKRALSSSSSSSLRASSVGVSGSTTTTSGDALKSLFAVDGGKNISVKTGSIPGPESLRLMKQMNAINENGAVHFFTDYQASKGNFIVDADGNSMLDMFSQIASLPLGYNHEALNEVATNPDNAWAFAQRSALGVLPPTQWSHSIGDVLMRVAPKGMDDVTTMACGSCANENAFKAAFIRHERNRRGGAAPTEEELESCMVGDAPGAPELSILSFKGAFHGRTLGCLSTTRSKAIHKLDVPHFQWPEAPFPRLRYPLEDHVEYNAAEEKRCIAETRAVLEAGTVNGASRKIAGVIVEPIQAEGGDNLATESFFNGLGALCKEFDVSFIVDEVQTGAGPTGKFWAHEHWNLGENGPDMVSFAKKMQIGGYYAKRDLRPKEAYRIFNTWMGDPAKALLLNAVLDTYERDNLVENAAVTGARIVSGLEDIQKKYPSLVGRARGLGTFASIDAVNPATRDAIIGELRARGVESGGSGECTLRLRPAMIFQEHHADQFLGILDEVCGSVEASPGGCSWPDAEAYPQMK